MATVEEPLTQPVTATSSSARRAATAQGRPLRDLLGPLASLRITVVLFALAIFLVLAGTLAQRFYDVWKPVNTMFRCWWAWVELRFFLPVSWAEPSPDIGFPFPGGWLIGGALGINLLAAHAVRFKAQARGQRLYVGLALVLAGLVATVGVIRSGAENTFLSQLQPEFANGLWHAVRATLGGGSLALAWALAVSWSQARGSNARWLWGLGGAIAAIGLGLTLALFIKPEWRLDDSGLRIVWQLAKALGVSLLLLLGCWLVFGKRAGIVLLHAGVALLMGSELHTGLTAVESQMVIPERGVAAYASDMRTAEVAIVDKSDPQADRVVRVPLALLERELAAEKPGAIVDDRLPVRIKPQRVLENSTLRWLQPGEKPLASEGWGQLRTVDESPASVGTDSEQQFDEPAAVIALLDPKTGEESGSLLLQTSLPPQAFTASNGKVYEASLRFRRIEKPYRVELLKFKAEQYVGSNTAKHYESLVRLTEPEKFVDQTVSIWMNNPLRYSGDTLYQSSFYSDGGVMHTVLQVMSNDGWLVPYLACVIVGVGMFAHFAGLMRRFVRRRDEETSRDATLISDAERAAGGGAFWPRRSLLRERRLPAVWVPALILLALGGWLAGRARAPRESAAQFHLSEFGQLPVANNGRLMPIDTLARNTLSAVSDKETYDDAETKRKEPAVKWFLAMTSDAPGWQKHRVLRIENLELLQALGLKPRPGFRYGFDELAKHEQEFNQQFALALQALQKAKERGALGLTQQKTLELGDRISQFTLVKNAFSTHQLAGSTPQELATSLRSEQDLIANLNERAPRAVPPVEPDGEWSTLRAEDVNDFKSLLAKRLAMPPVATNPAHELFRSMLEAYAEDRPGRFNERLSEYQTLIAERAAAETEFEAKLAAAGERGGRKFVEQLVPARIAREATYNRLGLFAVCMAFYIIAFVLAAAAWLGWNEGFNRAANWTLWLALAVHTTAIVARIYISGRPPVTNLYSAAVFIGWAAVLFSLVYESVYRSGIGNLLAAAIGFPSMVLASNLASGDTFTVMQAVLDTQFWLATHVVTVALGYSATFLAGFLGLFWIVLGRLGRVFDEQLQSQVTRMTYGTLCFAIFFSFVGTVLGGLWADDSWGRFWGWDPKENGALMIVLWNALVLHARWGKLVGPRGLAMLAVFGNVVTAWSFFGVNQLGVGLHSYGFTSGAALALLLFAISQLLVIAAAGWMGEAKPAGAAQT